MRLCTVILILVTLFSCRSSDKEPPVQETVAYAFPDTLLAWDTQFDSMIMKKDTTVPDSAITVSRIINGLNEKYPEVRLVFLKQSHDTVFTSVPDADYLGNQMGDAGAAAWYADVVINLTSVAGVNYVSFSMETQSHATGGVISRENYNAWKRQ
jgi:hypothetical protein